MVINALKNQSQNPADLFVNLFAANVGIQKSSEKTRWTTTNVENVFLLRYMTEKGKHCYTSLGFRL